MTGEKQQSQHQPRQAHPSPEESEAGMPNDEPEKNRQHDPGEEAKANRFCREIESLPVAEDHQGQEKNGKPASE